VIILIKIDYNRDITTEDIDLNDYDYKFKLCNMVKANKDTKLLAKLLNDPTTFSYLMFNLDGKPLKLYPYQDTIINDTHNRIYFRASNQIGKSLLLDVKAARNLIIDHGKGHNEAIVSKSLPQSTFQMRRIKSILNSMKQLSWKEEKGQSDSLSVISVDFRDDKGVIKYTNMLICCPSTEGLLGYDLHELNLDEFEFWEVDIEYFYNQIAQPRTYSTKGRIWIFSNPNGQDGFGSVLENQKDLAGNRKWHVYVFNYLDKPGNTIEEYDQLKYELTRTVFESTVAAIRSISDRNYFTVDEIERSLDTELTELDMVGKQPFFFLDVGSKHDQSVLVGGFIELEESEYGKRPIKKIYVPIIQCYPVGYPISRMVGSSSDNQSSDGWHYVKSVKEYVMEWSQSGTIAVLGCDVTGNSGISPLFQSVGINPLDIVFSAPNKSGMYQRFKYYMEKGLLHRVRSKEWDYQARHLVMERSDRGYLKIHHEVENDLDDCMDATAGLIYLSDPYSSAPVTLTIVGGKNG
jgi:hypothetical protein